MFETLDGLEIDVQNEAKTSYFGAGETENEIRVAIDEIEAVTPLTGVKRSAKRIAISLAKSIDRGNAKGRAVANEAAQLFQMMMQLAPAEDPSAVQDDAHLTPETRRLLDALAAPAQLDEAPPRDEA